ncbi:MAG TPA: protein-glutamate O-methyltransferase CheR [Dissulfurispiraceae bacterium]|nr:protein-glutamate O-methyltransferase CheR [Dissulfurispiraceae bacterium]
MTAPMADDVFKQLRDYIYEQSGIFIPDNKKYFLENRLGRRVQEKNLKGYDEYLYLLKFGGDKNELIKLFELVTTNETFFFREPQQFEVLCGELLKKIMEENTKAGRRDIRIWSAASSTGEEPYTISMMLMERSEAAGFRKEILASDISESVLASAKAAVYGSYAIRNVPAAYMSKYFTNTDQNYKLAESVKANVRFLKINLMSDREVRNIREVDVIFCRNVLIYFDEKAKQKTLALIYDALRPGGSLIVGTSESLHSITRAFRPAVINRVVIYQKV